MAHEAAGEQLREALVDGCRQGLDQSRLADIGVEHGEIAVDLHARRGECAAIP